MRQRYKIILAVGAALSLAVGLFFLLAGDGRQAESELIDGLAEAVGAECSAYALAERYESVYGICRRDGLRFRIDDLTSSPAEKIERFRAAIQVSCHAGLDGRLLRIPVLENGSMIVSAYFLADYRQPPDLSGLAGQLEAAGYQLILTDICQTAQPLQGKGIRASLTALSELAGAAEKFAAAEIQCDEHVFKAPSLGLTGLVCRAPEAPELVAVGLKGKTRSLEDAVANGFDSMAYCPGELSVRLIRLGKDLYVMAESAALGSLRERLAVSAGYDKAVVVEFCIGAS